MGKRDSFSEGEVSILSADVILEGKLKSDGSLRIDGKVNGDIEVKGSLTIGETAEINGNIKGANINLSGKVEGTVTADEKVVLEGSSKLTGDIFAKRLVISEGAVFDGKSSMSRQSQTSPINPAKIEEA
jgi:cytoskeletal protein CcmA (bactofilin family)